MKKITVLSLIKFTEEQLDKLRQVSPRLDVYQATAASVDKLPPSLRNNIEVLYGWGKTIDEAHRLPHLKWIQTYSAGVNNLLDKPVWQSPVIISSMNGIHAIPMAEHALAMMLAFRWQIPTMLNLQHQASWATERWDKFSRPELRESALGIVGYGAIGRELARQANALGMRVLATNRSGLRRPATGYNIPGVGDPQATIPDTIYPTNNLPAMLPQCDYVVVLTPLTLETRHLIDAAALESMKSSAVFINLSRGEVVDETALINTLQQGKIAGAGLDVFETEPLPADSPLWKLDNVIVSPHVSGFTPNYDDRASDVFAENLRRYLDGKTLLNQVKKERGY